MRRPTTLNRFHSVACAAWLISAAPLALAQDIIVTTLNDVVDFESPQHVANLPGPDNVISFREAIVAANNTPGPQTIEFAIPQSEWWLDTTMAILRLENSTFVLSGDDTTIDFTTQTDFTGDTNPNGWEVGIYGLQPNAWGVTAIRVTGDNCTIKGLGRVLQRGYGVSISGSNNRVIGCTISGPLYAAVIVETSIGAPNASNNVIGGTLPEERNYLSAGNAGVRIDGASYDNVVIGNTLVGSRISGVQVRGAFCCASYTPMNNRIGGPTPEEANWIADNGEYGEEGFPVGDQVRVEYAVGTVVENNIIGTTQDGLQRFPNAHGVYGVRVRVADDTVIRNNLIAGIRRVGVNHHAGDVYGVGIAVQGNGERTTIQGNVLGLGADGTTPIVNRSNISVEFFSGEDAPIDTLIGGERDGEGNVVTTSETFGVAVHPSAQRTTILRNSIFENGALGIDVGFAGVTTAGMPMLSDANGDGDSITITGTLSANPNQVYRIEFFENETCDPSGFGEGREFIGFTEVSTDASGDASFSATFDAQVDDGAPITATATSSTTWNTSEFSACVSASIDPSVLGDIDGDGVVDFTDLNLLLSAYNEQGENMPEDLDGDGDVDFADLNILLGQYNAGN